MSDLTDVERRFWAKVEPTGFCWNWTGGRRMTGREYGGFRMDGKAHLAHRVAWKFLMGEFPPGLEPDHLCRNQRCVNPDHLEWVTHRENVLRGKAIRGRRDYCRRGHRLVEGAYYQYANIRQCKSCTRDTAKERRRVR